MEKQIKKTSLKINFIMNTILQLINIIAPLLTAPYVSRVLGVEQIGVYSYVYSINYYFVMLASLGTATYGIIEIAKVRDDVEARSKCFWEIEIITVMTSMVCVFVWVISSVAYKENAYIMLAMTFYLFATIFDVSWFYIGIEKVKYTVITNAFFKLLGVALIFVFVRSQKDLVIYTAILSLTLFLGNLSMWMFLKKYICKSKISLNGIKKHFKGTILYFIPTIATSVYTVLDKTLIGVITHDNAENGYYEQATKIVTLVKTVSFTSLNTLLGSRMAYMFAKKETDEINKKRNLSIDFVLLTGIGACFGLVGVAHNFIPLFFGEEFIEASEFLMIMAPLLPIMGISNLIGNLYYNPTGQRKKSTIMLVIGCGVNIILNLIFIQFWAGKGAIIGTIIAEMLITFMYIYYSKGFVTFRMIFKALWKKNVAGLIMLIYILFVSETLRTGMLLLMIQCAGGLAIYLLVLLLLKEEFLIKYLNKIMRKILIKVRGEVSE